jgi:cytochrome oxidase Cu insertion factor (SCO1/SenC/PrrC family)
LSQTWLANGERLVEGVDPTFDDGQSPTTQWCAGYATIIALGYTPYPDICPTTLSGMSADLDTPAADGIAARGLVIAVVPRRDATGPFVSVRHSRPSTRRVTGTPETLHRAADTLGGAFRLTAGVKDTAVDPCKSVFVVDANVQGTGHLLRPSDGPILAPDQQQWALQDGPNLVNRNSWIRRPIAGSHVPTGYGVFENRGAHAATVVGVDSPASRDELRERVTERLLARTRRTLLAIEPNATTFYYDTAAHIS